MKVHVEFDMTAEEFRQLMGWPNVQKLQQDVINKALDPSKAENFQDTYQLFAPYFQNSFSSMEAFQKMMMSQYSKTFDSSDEKEGA